MLLSRLAWQLFWIGCNLQRAEDTARLVAAHLALADRTDEVAGPLLKEFIAIHGHAAPATDLAAASTTDLLRLVLADSANEASVASALARIDFDIRTARRLLPEAAWGHVHRMRQLCREMVTVPRAKRQVTIAEFVRAALALAGVISTGMLRDQGYQFWQLGRQLGGAEMVCGIVHTTWRVRGSGAGGASGTMLWAQVLQAMGQHEAYRSCHAGPLEYQETLDFLLHERRAPRSVAAGISKATAAAAVLPQNRAVLEALAHCRSALAHVSRRQAPDEPALARIGQRLDKVITVIHRHHFPVQ